MTPQNQTNTTCICGDRTCDIPYGKCHCRCGRTTTIAVQNNNRHGWRRGFPLKYCYGHQHVKPVKEEALPFKIDGEYCRLIPLSKGLYAIVLASDYDWLSNWAWQAWYSALAHCWYAVRSDPSGTYLMHREILGLGVGDKRLGDHRDTWNTLDNRRSNLRVATAQQSSANRRRNKNNTSGYKGVSWSERFQKWRAYISVERRQIHLGYFHDAKVAHMAYCVAAKKYFGEFARVA